MNVLVEEDAENQESSVSKKSEDYEECDYEDEYVESEGEPVDLGPVDITEETLKKIERELCLIKLCWPPLDLEDPYLAQLPESYRSTSDKEKLLLWYAENFRKQYHVIYPERKPLLLVCDNECGIQVRN